MRRQETNKNDRDAQYGGGMVMIASSAFAVCVYQLLARLLRGHVCDKAVAMYFWCHAIVALLCLYTARKQKHRLIADGSAM